MALAEAVDVLVIEDNDSQRASIVASIESAVQEASIAAVASGHAAIDLLFNHGMLEPPRLILLDLTLADGNALHILNRVRNVQDNEALAHIPVVIFSDSHDEDDIHEGYRLGANSFISKPLGFLEFQHMVGTVARYWLDCNQPPT